MKYFAIVFLSLGIASGSANHKLSASQCSSQQEALQAKAAEAQKNVDPSDHAAMMRAAAVAADSARAAADLDNGPCKAYSNQPHGRFLKM